MKNLDRAIDLAEEHCGTPFWEARDELEATRVKTRAFDLLWERAHTVIATFEALGKTRSVPEQLTLHKRCESAMVALKETLDETPEDESALAQPAAEVAPYSLDADPAGIRERVASAITGALAFGAQGVNEPPPGHWLEPFWEMARAERAAPQPAAAGAVNAVMRVSVSNGGHVAR